MAIETPYRAIFCDLLTDQTLDILPLRDVSFDDYIGKAGSLSGTVPIPDKAIADRVKKVREGRTAVYLERGGDLWWGGIVWTSTLQSSGRGVLTLGIQAATFDSYAGRRRIRTDITYDTPTDQLEIARRLWRELDVQTYPDAPAGEEPRRLGITFGNEIPKFQKTASWRKGDETVYLEALDQLAATENGFEHQILVYRDPVTGQRIRQLRIGEPKIVTGATDLVFDRPGVILSYSFPYDATRGGTTAVARGASTNANAAAESRPIFSGTQYASDLLVDGWPLIDLSSDHNEISDQLALDSVAATELAQARGAVVIPSISIHLGGIVPPALLGRVARIRITDEWYSQGLDARYRIIGVKITPPERGRADTAELYLEEA
ncbi:MULTISPECIES: hypothetical protein [Streptomyces]|uniref:Minor tail protein n=1 Tax=Streptomyces venezuelae (strain ATCC 10712 / CBS 650.69 / DSM 40230 / JCM 4526 / NBRC 13096 / PD 04745) TaxID=953739 RepID=F2RIT2_STRVP|nr:hypothetical protein [Streptomyces venezuelae]APE23332.1 hypothetical protein vnz_21505 [Streptomyces venezuelae]QES00710.1 hypothetical protein DEJ43_21820 [Streptomyces venezuelae ATCC 10712]QES07799.1 hypothetical protein DEJ44_20785 [Streptomyces venezuelae]CCA57638.1 hypothetical protein SVEN_4352 [Streptomyces venezuelae ATCC 10712]